MKRELIHPRLRGVATVALPSWLLALPRLHAPKLPTRGLFRLPSLFRALLRLLQPLSTPRRLVTRDAPRRASRSRFKAGTFSRTSRILSPNRLALAALTTADIPLPTAVISSAPRPAAWRSRQPGTLAPCRRSFPLVNTGEDLGNLCGEKAERCAGRIDGALNDPAIAALLLHHVHEFVRE